MKIFLILIKFSSLYTLSSQKKTSLTRLQEMENGGASLSKESEKGKKKKKDENRPAQCW